jgi:hypothetical protein
MIPLDSEFIRTHFYYDFETEILSLLIDLPPNVVSDGQYDLEQKLETLTLTKITFSKKLLT